MKLDGGFEKGKAKAGGGEGEVFAQKCLEWS